MSAMVEMIGKRFSRLLVVSQGAKKPRRCFMWNCICDCGSSVQVNGGHLRNGGTRSCGCLKREIAKAAGDRTRTHGLSGSSIYSIWDTMVRRCHAPGSKDFYRYGAKGITVCERWRTFENFYKDMGDRPAGMSIDRKDNAKGYEPSNCRWATNTQQQRNKRDNVILTMNGESLCVTEWAEKLHINKNTLHARLAKGWDVERALTQPINKIYSHQKNIGRRSPNVL